MKQCKDNIKQGKLSTKPSVFILITLVISVLGFLMAIYHNIETRKALGSIPVVSLITLLIN